MFHFLKRIVFFALNSTACCLMASYNQTATISPILPNALLPFEVEVELADFALPNGIHSFAQGTYNGKWLFIAGRTNGLHGFSPGNGNFPPSAQNTFVYVVDPVNEIVYARDLNDPRSGLSQRQIDLLSVTSPQSYVEGSTLYMAGGYGVDSETGNFSTKNCLTAIDLPGLIHWVRNPAPREKASQHIRQIFHPVFQITGGYMTKFKKHPTLLVFGQNFKGFYTPDSNGDYSEKVRRFHIIDDGQHLSVDVLSSTPEYHERAFRRRDLNVVPIIHHEDGRFRQQLIAFSGVFTPETGVWTVPVNISARGKTHMQNPLHPDTLRQGMNNYVCPTVGLFSEKTRDMYTIFFGGISFGYFNGGVFETDSEIPFINQITTINYDKQGKYSQYLMNGEYPVIISTGPNPGNPLLFGAGGVFIPAAGIKKYGGNVINLEAIKTPTLIGYIVGGIQSTLPNTNSQLDSAASPYIFKVTLVPTN